MQVKLIQYVQGLDTSATSSIGSNPSRLYTTRPRNPANQQYIDFGYEIGGGNRVTSTNISFLASYEIIENMFLDISAQNRTYRMNIGGNQDTKVFSLGFRWNMGRRDFDF